MDDQSNDNPTPIIPSEAHIPEPQIKEEIKLLSPGSIHENKNIKESEEDTELKQQLIPFEKFPKLKRWVELFTDKNNKATYGNRTESAMQSYDCKDRASASAIGVQNFRKLRGLASVFAEDKGVTVETLMNTLAARAVTSENPRWFELFAEMTDVRDPKGASIVVNANTQNNTQFNLTAPDTVNWNDKFKAFLESQ